MLEGTHCAWIDINIRVEFQNRDRIIRLSNRPKLTTIPANTRDYAASDKTNLVIEFF